MFILKGCGTYRAKFILFSSTLVSYDYTVKFRLTITEIAPSCRYHFASEVIVLLLSQAYWLNVGVIRVVESLGKLNQSDVMQLE